MSSNPDRLSILFEKYIAGTCNRQELDEFWKLLSELTEEERLSIGITKAWYVPEAVPHVSLEKEKWDAIYDRLKARIDIRKPKRFPLTVKINTYRAAAAVLVLLAAGYLFYQTLSKPGNQEFAASTIKMPEPVATDIRVLTLPDGTVVTLRKDSKLYYDSSFLSEKTREVSISGEVFFDVAHDKTRPFVVNFDKYRVYVLGTSFNVKTTTGKFEVTVSRGKVRVEESKNKRPIKILTPGNQLLMEETLEEEVAVTRSVDADSVSQWCRQHLVFSNDNWATAAEVLYKKYGVEVSVKNEDLNRCRFTADFSNKSLNECLDILCTLTKAKWYKTGLNTIYVDGNGCQ